MRKGSFKPAKVAMIAAFGCAFLFWSAAVLAQEGVGAKTVKQSVPVPATIPELDDLVRRIDLAGRGDDGDSKSSGLGPMITALAGVQDPKMAGRLIGHLRVTTSWKVKAGCVAALANIDTAESTDALVRFLKSVMDIDEKDDARPSVFRTQVDRWMFAACMQKAGRCVAERGRVAEVIEPLKKWHMVDELVAGGKPGLEALIAWSRDIKADRIDDSLPTGTTFAVARIRSADCLELLRDAALDKSVHDDVRQGAVQALAEGWGAGEYPLIVAVARTSTGPNLVRQSWKFAARLNPEAARPELRALLADRRPYIRGYAAYLLGSLGDPADIPRLEKLLKEEYDDVRLLTLEGLWLLDFKERTTTWKDPRCEERYRKWMDSHPKPVDAAPRGIEREPLKD